MSTTVLATARAMPKTMPADQSHPKPRAITAPSAVATSALGDGAGDGDAPDRQQLFDVELQADAEHQQDDADFRELFGDASVGDESGSVGADGDAGEQVADDRREAEALRDVAEDERRSEAPGKRQDEVEIVHEWIGTRPDKRSRGSRV